MEDETKTVLESFPAPEPWAMFLDDERDPSFIGGGDEWVVVRSSAEAISETVKRGSLPSKMSLDHDLGGDDTAMRFLRWATGFDEDWNFQYSVHSQNPVGRDNLISLLESYRRSR